MEADSLPPARNPGTSLCPSSFTQIATSTGNLSAILFFMGLAFWLYRQTQSQRYLVMLILFWLSVKCYYINFCHYTRAWSIETKIFLVAKEFESSSQKENNLSFLDRVVSKLQSGEIFLLLWRLS